MRIALGGEILDGRVKWVHDPELRRKSRQVRGLCKDRPRPADDLRLDKLTDSFPELDNLYSFLATSNLAQAKRAEAAKAQGYCGATRTTT